MMVRIVARILTDGQIFEKEMELPMYPLVGDELTVLDDGEDGLDGLVFMVVGRCWTSDKDELEVMVRFGGEITGERLLQYGWA